jgi:hypothetical protein
MADAVREKGGGADGIADASTQIAANVRVQRETNGTQPARNSRCAIEGPNLPRLYMREERR